MELHVVDYYKFLLWSYDHSNLQSSRCILGQPYMLNVVFYILLLKIQQEKRDFETQVCQMILIGLNIRRCNSIAGKKEVALNNEYEDVSCLYN